MFKNTYIFILLLFGGLLSAKAQNVEVEINNIRSTKGLIVLGVFIDNESFKKDTPHISEKIKKTSLKNGELKVGLNLEPGTYGFALLDDENNDNKMNYSFIGIPQEGFGFSNYYQTGLLRPNFDLFKFEVKENEIQTVNVKIKYM